MCLKEVIFLPNFIGEIVHDFPGNSDDFLGEM